ncbi:mycofactocin precursor MftA [Streptomyces sp. SID13726]|nr:mycofactocin precursor MftA [Streptomyces sp. SID13726]
MTEPRPTATVEARDEEAMAPDELIEADDLIEEVSIDGMCGVY